jgi:hypothetical protein
VLDLSRILCDVEKLGQTNLANGLAGPDLIQARAARLDGRDGRRAPTCIIGQSSGCLFLPLFGPVTAQGLGTTLMAANPSTLLTFKNYNNSRWLSGILG